MNDCAGWFGRRVGRSSQPSMPSRPASLPRHRRSSTCRPSGSVSWTPPMTEPAAVVGDVDLREQDQDIDQMRRQRAAIATSPARSQRGCRTDLNRWPAINDRLVRCRRQRADGIVAGASVRSSRLLRASTQLFRSRQDWPRWASLRQDRACPTPWLRSKIRMRGDFA